MLVNLIEVKAVYEKKMEDGKVKRVSEKYLVNDIALASAAERVVGEIRPYIDGEFDIVGVKKMNFSEFFYSPNGDKYFKAKLIFVCLDEKSGKEKKTSTCVLVGAINMDEANEKIKDSMKGTMSDYVIGNISETKYVDVLLNG